MSEASTAPTSERPRWAAFTVTIVVVVLLFVSPMIAIAAVPPRAENTVGVYERLTLIGADGDRAVVGGFIAPEGWVKLDDRDSDASRGSLATSDGSVTVTASMRTNVESSERLLREGVPIGATLSPIRRLDSAPLFTVEMLEYDLAAGSGVSQRIAVCEVLQGSSCLLFEIDIEAAPVGSGAGGVAGAGADALRPDIVAMVQSAEVQP